MLLQRTPLYAAHLALGGRMVNFGGWEMPVQYSGILDEHQTVRSSAGIFDISHMGQVSVHGGQADRFLNGLLTNDIHKLNPGQGQYTLMCNPQGGVIDDLIVYRTDPESYLVIVNASRMEVDVAWMTQEWEKSPYQNHVVIENLSTQRAAVAVQGPRTREFIDGCEMHPPASTPTAHASRLQKNHIGAFDFAGANVQIACTGYTGEDGFEVFAPAEVIERLWHKILDAGRSFSLKPAGLGARDTLRTEACYPLYGHELDEQTSPLEAGLGRFVAWNKDNFAGKEALVAQKARGLARQLIAFKMTEKSAPPRPQYPIWLAGASLAPIGRVASGTQSPSLGIGIGLGFVPPAQSAPGTPIAIEIRGKRAAAEVVKKPLYSATAKASS